MFNYFTGFHDDGVMIVIGIEFCFVSQHHGYFL
jgi:hypothetical protein